MGVLKVRAEVVNVYRQAVMFGAENLVAKEKTAGVKFVNRNKELGM